jgi:hypothetical protein
MPTLAKRAAALRSMRRTAALSARTAGRIA